MDKRLFRNEHDKVVAGVSSGIAEYMEVDVTIIRLLFVLSTIFLVGTGVLVYLVMWIVVPANNNPAARYSKFNDFFAEQQVPPAGAANNPESGQNTGTTETGIPNWTSSSFEEAKFKARQASDFKMVNKNSDTGRTVGGLFLLVIGIYFLMNEFDIIPYWFRLGKLWPLVFVAIGISFIAKSKRKNAFEDWKNRQEQAGSSAAQPKENVNLERDEPGAAV